MSFDFRFNWFQVVFMSVLVFFLSVMGFVTYTAQMRQKGRTAMDAGAIQQLRSKVSETIPSKVE